LLQLRTNSQFITTGDGSLVDHFWIDAICIDQSNYAEKAAQVNLMGKIYQKSTAVVVWLGKDRDDGEEIRDSIQLLSEADEAHIDAMASDNEFTPFPSDILFPEIHRQTILAPYGLRDWTTDRWKNLAGLLSRRWFGRIWVLQEAALSANTFFLYGSEAMHWDAIWGCAVFLSWTGLDIALESLHPYFFPGQSGSTRRLLGGFALFVTYSLRHMLGTIVGEAAGSVTPLSHASDMSLGLNGDEDIFKNTALVINYLLEDTSYYFATDPKDHVFALLGAVDGIADLKGLPKFALKADYYQSTVDIYRETTRIILEDTSSLGILSGVYSHSSRETQLPSWVPDFSASAFRSGPFWDKLSLRRKPFNAAGPHSAKSRHFSVHGSQLHVRHWQIGYVSDLGDKGHDLTTGKLFDGWARILVKMPATYHTGELRLAAFWRTLIADTEIHRQSSPDNCFEYYLKDVISNFISRAIGDGQSRTDCLAGLQDLHALGDREPSLAFLSTDGMPNWCDEIGLFEDMVDRKRFSALRIEFQDKGARFWEVVQAFFTYRRVIRTTEDHIGLGPESVDVGDRVCIVQGARTPFIIRKEEGYGPNEYRLIGDAYIHGMMHGEALKAPGFKWEDMVLLGRAPNQEGSQRPFNCHTKSLHLATRMALPSAEDLDKTARVTSLEHEVIRSHSL
jgi:Heterokaryon incompatibility protein (HET)